MKNWLNRFRKHSPLRQVGPGLITGAADDDPSGIATYSQAGAQFGLNMLWTVVFAYPLMVGIQVVSARIGRVTGKGLAANIQRIYPAWVLYGIVMLLLVANTINIAADIAAMGEALRLVVGGTAQAYAIMFGLISLLLQVFIPYKRYVRVLKWLTLTLFAYVGVVFTVQVPWDEVVARTLLPELVLNSDTVLVVVAVLGTTISPYLFFWQASQEVEEIRADPYAEALVDKPQSARRSLRRIKIDTYLGMGFSNLIAYSIILSAAVTLHNAGITSIENSAQAAQALRPVAGDLAFLLFSLGIIGTGMLAVPVLAGSTAYALTEILKLPNGLDRKPLQAKGFYGIIVFGTVAGALLSFTPIDPIKALFWSAVLNGVIAVPIMALMMLLGARRDIMGSFIITRRLQILGWLATLVMLVAVILMFVYW